MIQRLSKASCHGAGDIGATAVLKVLAMISENCSNRLSFKWGNYRQRRFLRTRADRFAICAAVYVTDMVGWEFSIVSTS